MNLKFHPHLSQLAIIFPLILFIFDLIIQCYLYQVLLSFQLYQMLLKFIITITSTLTLFKFQLPLFLNFQKYLYLYLFHHPHQSNLHTHIHLQNRHQLLIHYQSLIFSYYLYLPQFAFYLTFLAIPFLFVYLILSQNQDHLNHQMLV